VKHELKTGSLVRVQHSWAVEDIAGCLGVIVEVRHINGTLSSVYIFREKTTAWLEDYEFEVISVTPGDTQA